MQTTKRKPPTSVSGLSSVTSEGIDPLFYRSDYQCVSKVSLQTPPIPQQTVFCVLLLFYDLISTKV